MRVMLALILIVLAESGFGAEGGTPLTFDDMRTGTWIVPPQPMGIERRLQLIDMLEKYTSKYLDEVQQVDIDTFKGRQMDASNAIALRGEAEDVKHLMRENLLILKVLKRHPDSTREWGVITRNFYAVLSYIEDLERFKIVKSTDYVGVRMLMPIVFDQILLPATESTVK